MRDYQTRTTLVDTVDVAAGGTHTSSAVTTGKAVDDLTVIYQVGTLVGSSKAELQVKVGTDASGNDLWDTVDSDTGKTAVLTYGDPVEAVRIKITETGGLNGLQDCMAHLLVRG